MKTPLEQIADLRAALTSEEQQRLLRELEVTITSQQAITDERMFDLLVGALEGGSNGWYYIPDLPEIQKECDTFVDKVWAALQEGKLVKVYDIEDEEELLGTITKEGLLKGSILMRDTYPNHYKKVLEEYDDADTADVWFQLVVMGEIVYG